MNIAELTQKANEIKEAYAATNKKQWGAAEYLQGLVGDVGELSELVMAKNGYRSKENVDEKVSHELSDCLWSLLILAKELDVDLEKTFVKNMELLKQRIDTENQGSITISKIL